MTAALQGIKYLWHLPCAQKEKIFEIASSFSLHTPLAAVLAERHKTLEEIRLFLQPNFPDISHLFLMKDVKQAAQRLIQAIERKEKILICGDYDVDGVTSSALVLACLLPLGAHINFFLPHRVKDGYGLSPSTVQKAVASGYKLLITVDNGITCHAAANCAQEYGIDLIITDHHMPHEKLPTSHSIVNPQQYDCAYPYKYFAGVGVVFKVMECVYHLLGKKLPQKVYELLLLGTIADVVPLTGENRYWVQHGLALLKKQKGLALQTLAQNAGLSKTEWDSLDIGFMIAPQINALGRLDDPREAVTFLLSSDEEKVARIGATLSSINEERKRIDRTIFEQIEKKIHSKEINVEKEYVIMAADTAWPPGVIGLVASKLCAAYARPTLLFHLTQDGIAKGSFRSIKKFHLFNALSEAKDLFISFGGHAHAAGAQLYATHLPALHAHLSTQVSKQCMKEDLVPSLYIDAHLEGASLSLSLVRQMKLLEPFGHHNPQPLFYIGPAVLHGTPYLLKEKHVKATFYIQGIFCSTIFFQRPDLYSLFLECPDHSFLIAGHVTCNEWNGKISLQIQGIDVAFSEN